MFVSDNGWRAKIGLLLPSTNTVVEQWFNRMAPDGVSFHSARMTIKIATAEGAREMGEGTMAAAAQLADCRVDAIAHCCTAGSFSRGPDYDQEIESKIKAEFGLPCITATASIVKAFKTLNMKNIVSLSPYMDDVQELAKRYFEAHGVKVEHSKILGITSLHGFCEPSPDEIYRLAKATWDEHPDGDGFFMGCLDFRGHEVIHFLEQYMGKPVVTACQATLWAALRLAGIKDPISRYGSLMTI